MVAHERNMNLHTKFQSLKQRHFQIISQTPEEVFIDFQILRIGYLNNNK